MANQGKYFENEIQGSKVFKVFQRANLGLPKQTNG
jgi:hypothetical protein